MGTLINFFIVVVVCIILLIIANKTNVPLALKKLINIIIAMVVIIYIFQYLSLIPILLPMLQ